MKFKVKIKNIGESIFYIKANSEKELRKKTRKRIENLIQFEIMPIDDEFIKEIEKLEGKDE